MNKTGPFFLICNEISNLNVPLQIFRADDVPVHKQYFHGILAKQGKQAGTDQCNEARRKTRFFWRESLQEEKRRKHFVKIGSGRWTLDPIKMLILGGGKKQGR